MVPVKTCLKPVWNWFKPVWFLFQLDSRENVSSSREPSLHTDDPDSAARQTFSPVASKGKKKFLPPL
jgi:hypothetical protein